MVVGLNYEKGNLIMTNTKWLLHLNGIFIENISSTMKKMAKTVKQKEQRKLDLYRGVSDHTELEYVSISPSPG
jgi:hypothetical protein